MALSDFFEIRCKSRQGSSEEMLNVWHVHQLGLFTAVEIGEAFVDTALSAITALQSSFISYTSMDVWNLGDPIDFITVDLTGSGGARAGEVLPIHNAVEIRFNRTRRDMRHGHKRIGGIVETDSVSGGLATLFMVDVVAACATILADWERSAFPGVSVCEYVIIKRIPIVDPITGETTGYRLPTIDGELVSYRPLTASPADFISHQVSRKLF